MKMCKSQFLRLLFLGAFAIVVLPLAAETVGGLTWTAPSQWQPEAKRMRAANYVISAVAGDSETGECAVYYFGPGQGGSVDANIKRWIGQFQAPGGGPADDLVKTEKKTISGINVTTVDLSGTYLFKPFPMAPKATPKPGYRMLAAIAEGPDAPLFFKLTAPKKTADAAESAFYEMLQSLKKN